MRVCPSMLDTCGLSSKENESEWGSVLNQKENGWKIEMRWPDSFRKGELMS